jgi:predicted dehydrogenase
MKSTVRLGIIGVGQIGKIHLSNYSKIPSAEVISVSDINKAELRKVAKKFGVPDAYIDFRELLERDDIDAVDVCLHNNLHSPMTIASLEAGKHVYCEKPMAGTYVDAKAMFDTAQRCNRKLSIQLNTIFSKETKVAKRLIDEGHLGHIYHANSAGHRRRGRPFVDGYGSANFVKKEVAAGGTLYDVGVYHIGQMLYLLNLPRVERISGKIYQETDMDEGRRLSSGYNVEELGLGFVRFAAGLTLNIIESWAIHLDPFAGSYVVGSKAGIRLNPFSFHTSFSDMDMDATFDLESADWRWHQLRDSEDAYDSPQHHWIAALQGRVPLIPTDRIALQTMLISEGIYLSDKLGSEVTQKDVEKNSKSTALELNDL